MNWWNKNEKRLMDRMTYVVYVWRWWLGPWCERNLNPCAHRQAKQRRRRESQLPANHALSFMFWPHVNDKWTGKKGQQMSTGGNTTLNDAPKQAPKLWDDDKNEWMRSMVNETASALTNVTSRCDLRARMRPCRESAAILRFSDSPVVLLFLVNVPAHWTYPGPDAEPSSGGDRITRISDAESPRTAKSHQFIIRLIKVRRVGLLC